MKTEVVRAVRSSSPSRRGEKTQLKTGKDGRGKTVAPNAVSPPDAEVGESLPPFLLCTKFSTSPVPLPPAFRPRVPSNFCGGASPPSIASSPHREAHDRAGRAIRKRPDHIPRGSHVRLPSKHKTRTRQTPLTPFADVLLPHPLSISSFSFSLLLPTHLRSSAPYFDQSRG